MSELYASYPHLLTPRLVMRTPSSTSSARSQTTPKPQHSNLSLGGLAPSASASASASSSSLGLGGKLMGLLDRQKYAIFQIELTLHDLANVPQLEGEFAVRWRFRGKRPKARDVVHSESSSSKNTTSHHKYYLREVTEVHLPLRHW